jgi:hypothetical protein
MDLNRIFAREPGAWPAPRPGGGADMRKIGPLKLPMPSGEARAESLDDGTLQIIDTLPLGPLGDFVADVARMVRVGEVEPPASFAVAVRDGMTVRFERGAVRDDLAARMAGAIEGIADSIRGGRVDAVSFAMSLDCGCGLRVERGDGLQGGPTPSAAQPR